MFYIPHQSFDFDSAICMGYVTYFVKSHYPKIKLSKWPNNCASLLREDGCEFSLVGSSLDGNMVGYIVPYEPPGLRIPAGRRASSRAAPYPGLEFDFGVHESMFRHFLNYLESYGQFKL